MERKPKRTKVAAACSACQARKSRCELLTEHGCHRCRVLGTPCSLKQGSPHDDEPREPSAGRDESVGGERKRPVDGDDGEALRYRVEALESRLQAVESHLERRSPSPLRPTARRPRRDSPTTEDETLGRTLIKYPAPYDAIPEMMGVDFGARWCDPLANGLITEGQMQAAYLSFTHIFTPILPWRQLTSAVPRHPFLQSCILAYLALLPPTANPLTPRQSRHILDTVLHENLGHALGSPPSLPIIRGLIILSHLPGFPMIPADAAEGRALPSSLVVVQLAKSMAMALGMDRASSRMVGFSEDGLDGVLVRGLDGYLLWRCILQQEFWVSLVMSAYVPTQLTPTTLEHLETSHDEPERASLPLARHIRHTAALQAIMAPLLETVQRIGDTPSDGDFQDVKHGFGVFLEGLSKWYAGFPRDAARYLYITARQYDYAAHLRVAGWIQRLPRPIISELLYQLLQYVGRSLIQSSMHVIVALSSHKDLQVFMPGGQHTLSLFAWAGLMNIQAMFQNDPNHQDWTGRRHKSHLEAFEATLMGLYPEVAGKVMGKLKVWLARVQPHEEGTRRRMNIPVRRDVWEPSAGVAFQPVTSDIRHEVMYAQPEGADFPVNGGPLLPLPGYEFPTHPLAPATGMPPVVPFLGEFTPQEMAAFETWWFDMLDVDAGEAAGSS